MFSIGLFPITQNSMEIALGESIMIPGAFKAITNNSGKYLAFNMNKNLSKCLKSRLEHENLNFGLLKSMLQLLWHLKILTIKHGYFWRKRNFNECLLQRLLIFSNFLFKYNNYINQINLLSWFPLFFNKEV